MNKPARPPTPPNDENMLDEGVRVLGGIGRELMNFLTSDSNEDFCDGFDKRHGTNTREIASKIAEKKAAIDARVSGRRPAPTPSEHPIAALCDGPPNAHAVVSAVVDDDAAVIVIEEDEECAFCHGKPVVKMNRTTRVRTKIACPECGKGP